jgi:zinc transporter ZupT
MAHEVPHELGDYAVLKSCGWSKQEIIVSQIGTGLVSLVATVVSCALGHWSAPVAAWMAPFVAGTFIYVGAVTILGELVQRSPSGLGQALIWSAAQAVSFSLGVLILIAVAFLEEHR